MAHITVTLSDSEMAQLSAIAKAGNMAPEEVVTAHVKSLVLKVSTNAQATQLADPDRQRRLAVASKILGLWKDRTDIPKDGLEYQEEMRAEWR
ncbi:hypothetical protein [Pseudoduganella namucuonensis]|uniref:CopG family transcriptional regulator n=1 Tax=Pseudoduganella namucuonensis TaxID=1035707 RepID=A0A1I7M745_9BURK|nr:hypothetical protein [Pseudoduganella namucuonensis]SFV17779.1 hypothetical protein SAMN05216552_107411 [Pseudoduganella namucuonensis]